LTSSNVYSLQKGQDSPRFETHTQEEIKSPPSDSRLTQHFISQLQHPVHPNISSTMLLPFVYK